LILNVSSILGSITQYTTAPLEILPEYGTTKSALNSLTVQWAVHEKEQGTSVRVVAVCPGASSRTYHACCATRSGTLLIYSIFFISQGTTRPI
jgi:NAD(P)-dependent dehydrogenase (short-subunit alcohol dehydrogenase family)